MRQRERRGKRVLHENSFHRALWKLIMQTQELLVLSPISTTPKPSPLSQNNKGSKKSSCIFFTSIIFPPSESLCEYGVLYVFFLFGTVRERLMIRERRAAGERLMVLVLFSLYVSTLLLPFSNFFSFSLPFCKSLIMPFFMVYVLIYNFWIYRTFNVEAFKCFLFRFSFAFLGPQGYWWCDDTILIDKKKRGERTENCVRVRMMGEH